MFVIQTKNNQIATDIGRAIYEASEFASWLGHNPIHFRLQDFLGSICSTDIPVGTIEWTECVSNRKLKPTNLPLNLCKYPFVHRYVAIMDRPNLASFFVQAQLKEQASNMTNKKYFIKSASQVKNFNPVLTRSLIDVPDDTLYFVSEEIDIETEWRAFVFHGEVLDVKMYSGTWDKPLTATEIQIFKNQIKQANLPLKACTVDFARTNNGIEWIEVHNFLCCGLYGFDDICKIAKMTKAAWEDEMKNVN